MTPLLEQYFNLKAQYPDCLLLFQVGDFFEAYGEDAKLASAALNILLTAKDAGKGSKISMAGVPVHSVDAYLRRLVRQGFKVALSEQMENPKHAKGLVKRDVVRIITSGTILDSKMLDAGKNNWLCAVVHGLPGAGFALADISTGSFQGACLDSPAALEEELRKWKPAEALLPGSPDESYEALRQQLEAQGIPVHTLELREPEANRANLAALDERGDNGRDIPAPLLQAAGLIMQYLQSTQKTVRLALTPLKIFQPGEHLIIDDTTARNLELVRTLLEDTKDGSLLGILDGCKTAMGSRLLRNWLLRPSKDASEINQRLDLVAELCAQPLLIEDIRSALSGLYDIERLLTKAVYGTANARDVLALGKSLEILPGLKTHLAQLSSARGRHLQQELNPLEDLKQEILSAICPEPAAGIKEGGIIADGYHAELDDLRSIRSRSKTYITGLEQREKLRLGIKNLKISYNSVFGYFVEITKSNLNLAPPDYVRKQTVAGGERFIFQELKDYEAKILGAEERIKNLEYELFIELRGKISQVQQAVIRLCHILAQTDVLSSFAALALESNYTRPTLVNANKMVIIEGRHPVVEKHVRGGFVPNETYLEDGKAVFLLVTGPNMSGKSTYLRQIALLTIMAQMGSFVPARSFTLGLTDRIFTRVGASDDLHLGQSTFMVEMTETANIIKNATPQSLVILDEVGRGTSTFDGLSLAWAIAEYLYEKVQCKTLFATHYYELTQLSKRYPGIKNLQVTVQETGSEVVFLHKIAPGGANKSYGIHVAKLAGLPPEVLERARILLGELQDDSIKTKVAAQEAVQLNLFSEPQPHPVLETIRNLNLEAITPIEALNLINQWKKAI